MNGEQKPEQQRNTGVYKTGISARLPNALVQQQ
jgi:hypothetical protein